MLRGLEIGNSGRGVRGEVRGEVTLVSISGKVGSRVVVHRSPVLLNCPLDPLSLFHTLPWNSALASSFSPPLLVPRATVFTSAIPPSPEFGGGIIKRCVGGDDVVVVYLRYLERWRDQFEERIMERCRNRVMPNSILCCVFGGCGLCVCVSWGKGGKSRRVDVSERK